MTTTPMLLEARNIIVTRGGTEVLNVPYFFLREREILSLIGPNGSGKSTLLLTLACLLKPAAGEVLYRGEHIITEQSKLAHRRRLTMVFQEPLLFDATVYDNVAAGLKIRRMTSRETRNRVMETLELVNMAQLADRSARKLSGGEAQRTSLARAFAVKPEIIFLDEPFTALDPPTRHALTEDLERILRETGTTAIVATHDRLEALRLSSRMAVVSGGKIVQSGQPADVMHRPANELVAAFVGMENVLSAEVKGASAGMLTLSLAEQHIEVAGNGTPGETAVFCIRPEHVTITTGDPGGATSARNVFSSTITRIIHMGVYSKIDLDCGFPLIAYLTSQSVGMLHLEVGKHVHVSFKATAVHLIRSGKLDT